MTIHGGERIATGAGAMLVDASLLGREADSTAEAIFEFDHWRSRGEIAAAALGRGSAWLITTPTHHWVLRHYRRGGSVARRLLVDRYVWAGEQRVRAFAEWRLLARLHASGLPVPRPIAARYRRSGLLYRCDLIMQRIKDAEPLSAMLVGAALADERWSAIGAVIARLHAAGVDHADLNAHNILLDSRGGVSVIDFDRGKLRPPGSWQARNLQRLHRSLRKISAALPAERFSAAAWNCLLAGYARA
ncbi:MAG: 3-deoxy-D-manno-octulosonic acid kinase [Steroidobacteraceae bacterium]|jgi:3-deoxy-D-manno-octulosonic acid kinase